MSVFFALSFYAFLASCFLIRLFPIWSACIPGGLQDTRLFLWNAWWFHHAVESLHATPFYTPLLFHPFGVSLVSHDFPLWHALVTFFAQRGGLPLIASSNAWFWLTWTLTGFCSYLLAWEATRRRGPALVAGIFVMTHSYTLARAMQNWGQFNVYGIPLFLWTLQRAHRTERRRDYFLSGLALAWTAACHFYFLIYSGLIWLACLLAGNWPYSYGLVFQREAKTRRWIFWWIVAAIAGAVAGWIILKRPGRLMLGAHRVGLESAANPLLVMWGSLFLGALSRFKFTTARRERAAAPRGRLRREALLLGTALLGLSPLLWSAARLAWQGDYPSQSILWKTHLPGANLLALFMPNPLHAVWGPPVSRWFVERGLNPQEQAASLGWVFLFFVFAGRLWRERGPARRWLALACAGTVCSMGTYLHIAQWNLWLPLPFYFLRLIPLLSNVRVPERWMAVGAVSGGVVLALAIHRLSERKGWSLKRVCLAAGVLVLCENWPGIPVAAPPAKRAVYDVLRNQPPGGVLTVPLIVGDSSIAAGDALPGPFIFPWDHLWAQTFHRHPILGGYIGRIPRRLVRLYQADPFMRNLLALEEGTAGVSGGAGPPEADRTACRMARDWDVSYLLAYPQATRPQAWDFVRSNLPLKLIGSSDGAELYRLDLSDLGCSALR